MDETPAKIKAQQLMKLHLKTDAKPQLETLQSVRSESTIEGIQRFFAWTYKDLKRIPLKLAQCIIELNTIIPSTYQARYKLNPNYATIIKQDIDKLLIAGVIQFIEEATWLSPIVIIPKNNCKLKIYIDFRKLNVATKKDSYPLPFIDEVLNIIIGY